MRGLRGCASDCCPCSIVGHAASASPATGPPDTGAGSHTKAVRSVEEGRRGLRLLGRRWQTLEADHVAVWQEQAGPESDASWAPAQGAAGLCTSDPLKGRQDWARALLPRGHPHAPGPWPPRKTRDQRICLLGTVPITLAMRPLGALPKNSRDLSVFCYQEVGGDVVLSFTMLDDQIVLHGPMGVFPVGSAWKTTAAVQCGDASLKTRAQTEQCSYGLRRFLETGHVHSTKKACACSLQHA